MLFEPEHGCTAWLAELVRLREEGAACALVTPVRGDAAEGRLVVTTATSFGTLGSTTGDDEAVTLARAVLRTGGKPTLATLRGDTRIEVFVDIVRPPDFRVVLFGAGHVGRAVVRVLVSIRCRIKRVDTRDNFFPAATPEIVERVTTDTPEAEIAAAPAGAYFLEVIAIAVAAELLQVQCKKAAAETGFNSRRA